ncbi:unnamed protein product [Arabis nemorensis]|uniref:Uncharacterized protein n=1 Tax=Arabis nemorensis TaxID=586526 RepID=A0A565CB81_9BRAS|nr:unnamed protein product [Arabis nemorensis]
MEVLVGSSVGIGTTAAQVKDVPESLFLTEESKRGGESRIGLRSFGRSPADELPESSSSILFLLSTFL